MRGIRGLSFSASPLGFGASLVVSVLLSGMLLIGGADPADARARRSEQPKAAAKAKAKEPKALERQALPLLIIISIPRQRVTVYAGNEKIAEAPVSTGQRGFETPTGLFTLLERNRTHFSNLYGGAPMPFMQRITWSGVALHAGVLPGYPASHGCIRLPFAFARELFGITSLGARVIITRDDITPAHVVHGKLIAPLPSEVAASEPVPTRTAEAGTIEVATTDTGAGSGEFNLLSGMSRMAAAATGPAQPRTREEAAAMRAAELAGYEGAVKTAEAARKDAEARLEAAQAALRVAMDEVKPARVEAEKLARLASKAEGGKEAAEDRLEFLTQRAERRPTRSNLEALAESKPILEERIKTFEANGAPARALADEAARELKRRVETVEAKDSERDDAAAAVKAAGDAIKTAQQAFLTAKRALARREMPISILVSRKAGKLFVRQGYEPIAEAPVTIERADQPLGTHVFTALETIDGGNALRWNAVTIPTKVAIAAEKETVKRKGEKSATPETTDAPPAGPAPLQTASVALDRVTFPEETQHLLSELVKPGSSLVISDYDMSNETGKYTDFILLTRHPEEPARVKKSRRVRSVGASRPRRYRPPPLSFW